MEIPVDAGSLPHCRGAAGALGGVYARGSFQDPESP